MKVLIIYAHPKSSINGFSSLFLEETARALKDRNISFEILDLYEMGYDPVLKIGELYTEGFKDISEQNQQIQQKIKDSNGLIFIYPIWWGGMPAILKGFMDRVFTPGFAFKYRKEKFLNFIPDKLLAGKKILVLTNYGGPSFAYRFLGNPVKTIEKLVIFGLFSSKIKISQLYKADRLDNAKAIKIKQMAQKGINWIAK